MPLVIAAVAICALFKKTDMFPALTRGALQGLFTIKDMLPALTVLFPAVYMLRASGALDALARLLAPAMAYIRVPPETLPLALNETAFAFQLMQELSGFLIGAAHSLHDVLDGEDDIHPVFFILPAVLCRKAHAVKQKSVEHFGFCGDSLKPFLCEQHLGDAIERELFRLRAIEVIIHRDRHAPSAIPRRA